MSQIDDNMQTKVNLTRPLINGAEFNTGTRTRTRTLRGRPSGRVVLSSHLVLILALHAIPQ